ncbi:hypothetical protein DVK85_03920 [Flavobacterium arcticum]|uniref:TonB C-terminal domain-containing protein n=1 Tax=Flavobacterium arcticum TaxID=1784713 RepID=A0A345HA13_9FLAO|nr:hypothetical protein [Flavobacterium arcticum]AXG73423.1 hypothetical protein DVK85_03920 [Flavobacterium arcticum]KAF2513210.1 hypothetical protein E0W72_01970 [Flavobacterium arcticum]
MKNTASKNFFTIAITSLMVLLCFRVSAQEISEKESSRKVLDSTDIVHKQPQYPGGQKELYNDLLQSFKTPKAPDGTYKIYISFSVEKDGSMSNIKTIKDPGYGMGEEAIRALKSIDKKWAPGENRSGKLLRVAFTLPLTINITK